MAVQPNVPSDNYPFATKDGKVIPLDIIKPQGVIFHSFTLGAFSEVTIPAGKSTVAILYATEACFISFGSNPASFLEDAYHDKVLFIPRGHVVATTVEVGNIYVKGFSTNGILNIQFIEKWAGLSLDMSFTKR